jgi:hypothetical protein
MTTIVNISTILMKRGNTSAASNYVGPLGELLLDTGSQTLRLQDGATPGGMTTLATTQQLSNVIAAIEGIQGNVTANVQALLANISASGITQIAANVANLQANSNSLNNGVYSAVLGANGELILPSGGAIGPAFNMSSLVGITPPPGGEAFFSSTSGNAAIGIDDNGFAWVQTGGNGEWNWRFKKDGLTEIPGDLSIAGNLIVNGNATTISTSNLIVDDNIIYMANGNPANTLDIGFAGHFNNGTYQHTGLVRQATSGQWKLFSNVAAEPGNTINFTNAVYDPIQVGAITSPTIVDLYANAAVQAGNITTLFSNAAVQSANIATLQSNAASQATDITTLYSNAATQASSIATLTSNAAAQATDITTLYANAASQATDITTLYSNAATQASSLNTITANLGILYTGNISTNANIGLVYANLITQQGNYNTLNANVGAYEIYANANAAGQATSLNSITANIGSFYTYANLNYGTSSYANANVAAYLVANPQSGTYSNTNVSAYLTSQNITSANIGAYYAFANANLATQTTNINNITANIGSFYAYANATYSTGGGGSGTYSNANVVSMLSANTAVFIGAVGNVIATPIQSNITQVFIGNSTAISSGNAATPSSTYLMWNTYLAANGTPLTRNTQTGSGLISIDSTGIALSGNTGAVTANATAILTQYLKMNGTNGAQFALPITSTGALTGVGVTSTGAIAVNAVGGITTNQATVPVFPATATTINFGGAATTITLGTTTAATASNVFVANAVGTNTGNLTVRAFGTYNTLSLYAIQGGYNSPPYTNQSLTGGTGTGMTANYSSVGGYISTITVSSPGTGYKNGDVLTVPGGLGTTVILTNYNANKTGTGLADSIFTMDGNLILPGNVTIPTTANITGNLIGTHYGTHYGNTIGTTATYTGNVAANYFTGNGAALTGISSVGNIYGSSSNVTLVAGSYSSVFDNTGNVSLPGNLKVANTITINNVTTTMATNGYNNWRGNTYANVDNISASVFSNGAPAFSSILGTLNYFWSSVTNLTGGKFFGNTSTGGAITTSPTTIGTGITLGSGGDTVIVTLQDQDLKRIYTVTYVQTVGSGNCAIVAKRIL